jgi:transposase
VPRLHDLAAHSVGLADGIAELVAAQRWLAGQVRLADAEIARLDAEIERTLEAWSPRDRAVLASFPALGQTRQAILLAAIGDVRRFRDDRALRKYLGWYAELAQSGTSVDRHRLGTVGERNARRMIWLWALSLVTPQAGETPFKTWYLGLRARGMRGNVAIGHLASKLVSVVYYCLLRGEPYDPERHWRELGLAPRVKPATEPDERPDA